MSVAICIPTYNSRSQLAETVLSYSIDTYKKYGIDVYYVDSSEDNSIKKVVDDYRSRGYENVKYIAAVSGQNKLALYYTGSGLDKEYDYIWAVKDRVFFDEQTLIKVLDAMEEGYDAILLGVLPENVKGEAKTRVYDKPEEFYHDWGFMATSIDVTILKRKSMLNGLTYNDVEKCNPAFTHFQLLFQGLAVGDKRVKVLVGNDVVARNIQGTSSGYYSKVFGIWKDNWISVNKNLPNIYDAYKQEVIKHAANLPWIFGTVGMLMQYKKNGAFEKDSLDNILTNWELVSDIPKEKVAAIANGTYDISHDLSVIPKDMPEIVGLLVQVAKKMEIGHMRVEQVPFESIFNAIMNNVIRRYNGNPYIVQPIKGSVEDVMSYICNKAQTQDEIQRAFQVIISMLMLSL
ncbi:MAG: glycosyltransferase [Lachnospiraceae bacterium]|nr:glycosyltransferase [Lachnospiraceae bacterium]